jgi:hypothetical protein
VHRDKDAGDTINDKTMLGSSLGIVFPERDLDSMVPLRLQSKVF